MKSTINSVKFTFTGRTKFSSSVSSSKWEMLCVSFDSIVAKAGTHDGFYDSRGNVRVSLFLLRSIVSRCCSDSIGARWKKEERKKEKRNKTTLRWSITFHSWICCRSRVIIYGVIIANSTINAILITSLRGKTRFVAFGFWVNFYLQLRQSCRWFSL